MTALTSFEVESYFERVYDALADLPDEVRDELLEELPDHLAEVVAEEGGSLVDRLGEPEVYAAELRSAAGIETPKSDFERNLLAEWWVKGERWARDANVRSARLIGYDKVTDLVKALRPGWWVLRGWLVAELVCGTHDRATWHGFIPSVGGNAVFGFVLLLVAIVASLWLGRRSVAWTVWPRRLSVIVSIALAFWGVAVLAKNIGGTEYAYDYSNSGYSNPLDSVQDVFVYDVNGKQVPNARLFDQDGNPIQLGNTYCADGENAPYVNAQTAWTYPICPSDPQPFRAGTGSTDAQPPTVSAPSDGPIPTPTASASSASTGVSAPPVTKAPKASVPKASPTASRSR